MKLRIDCPATYPENCKVVCVGEAPGEDEIIAKEGFAGRAGKVLQKIIYVSGLSWDEIGRTNVVKRAPDGGFTSEAFDTTFYTKDRVGRSIVRRSTQELDSYLELLREELYSATKRGVSIAIACGNEALKALTGCNGITKYRGSILPSTLVPGLCVIPIMHPSWIVRSAQWQELFISSEIFRKKVFPILTNASRLWAPKRIVEFLRPEIEDVEQFLQKAAEAKLVSLDIETRAGSIACFGLCYTVAGVDYAICIPIQTTVGPYWSVENEAQVWRGLQWLLDNQTVVGHNISYDLDWLRDYGINPTNVQDTMLLFHRVFPELPKGLDFCSLWFTELPYYKDDGKTWGYKQPDEKLWKYNIKDVVATIRVWQELQQAKDTTGYKLYTNYTRKLMPIAFEMQTLGMDADKDGVEVARSVLMAELEKVRNKLLLLSDGKLVVLPKNKKITDKQVMQYLYVDLNLKPVTNFKTKRPTADEDALVELLMRNPELEVLKAINAERKVNKALNSYINIRWKE